MDKLGFGVFAACLTKEGEESLEAVTSSRVFALSLDVTDSQRVKAVYERVTELLPPDCVLWGVVNNAGVTSVGLIDWMPFEEFKQMADVNLWGLIDVTKTFLPLVKKAEGRVVNISSMLGQFVVPMSCAYCITKYGVEAFSDALRREMSPWKVRVSIIEPGSFNTGLMDGNKAERILRGRWESLSEEVKNDYSEEYLERSMKNFHKGLRMCSSHTYKVVDAVVDALMSSNPQTRYQVGIDSKLLTFMALLPSSGPDKVLERLFMQNPK
ncbi:hypothetical protein ACROYT_G000157 [Oculina patagonica]